MIILAEVIKKKINLIQKGSDKMSEEKRVLELDKYEHKAIANILFEKRTTLIEENKGKDFIDEILEKVLDAPTKKKTLFKKDKNKDER